VPHALELPPGRSLLIVDAGGGTADVTLHTIVSRGGEAALSEAARSRGGLCGGVAVDAAFEAHLREEVGAAAFDDWKEKEPEGWFGVRARWELVKSAFAGPDQARPPAAAAAAARNRRRRAPPPLRILIPLSIDPSLRRLTQGERAPAGGEDSASDDEEGDLLFSEAALGGGGGGGGGAAPYLPLPDSLLRRMSPEDHAALSCAAASGGRNDRLCLDAGTLQGFFDPTVGRVIALARAALAEGAANGVAPDDVTLLLVGGFGESPYLARRLREALAAGDAGGAASAGGGDGGGGARVAEVVVPRAASAAVVTGAVLFGCKPHLIFARRARLSYGVRGSGPYRLGAPGKYWCDEMQAYYCDDYFSQFVAAGQLVAAEETVEHLFLPFSADQTEALIDLHATDQARARGTLPRCWEEEEGAGGAVEQGASLPHSPMPC
jgi:hypothetical protein